VVSRLPRSQFLDRNYSPSDHKNRCELHLHKDPSSGEKSGVSVNCFMLSPYPRLTIFTISLLVVLNQITLWGLTYWKYRHTTRPGWSVPPLVRLVLRDHSWVLFVVAGATWVIILLCVLGLSTEDWALDLHRPPPFSSSVFVPCPPGGTSYGIVCPNSFPLGQLSNETDICSASLAAHFLFWYVFFFLLEWNHTFTYFFFI
jgi:hypothetical protein